MRSQEPHFLPGSHESALDRPLSPGTRRRISTVIQARAKAQRAKIDQEAQSRQQQAALFEEEKREEETHPQKMQARRRTKMTVERAIDDYLDDHIGGNHSDKTVEWHRTALGLLQAYLAESREITLVGEIDAPGITAWFTHLPTGCATRFTSAAN